MRYTVLLLLCLAQTAWGQTAISQYRPGVTTDGVVYLLPKTVLRVTLRIEKTTYTPGDFSGYAARYLRRYDVGQEAAVSHRLLSAKVSAVGQADKSRAFSVKYNAKSAAANVTLADDGRLLAINCTPAAQPEAKPFSPAPRKKGRNPREFLSQEILAAGSISKMAQLTAAEIYDIRDSKNQLTRGEADFMPKDGAQLRLMLQQLEAQDAGLSSMFLGQTQTDTIEQTVDYCPTEEVTNAVLFRLSDAAGVVDNDDLSGAPYYISIANQHTLPDPEELDPKAKAKYEKSRQQDDGIWVCVPEKVRATITDGRKPLATVDVQTAQFGHVELLAGGLFNKHFTTELLLSPVTGAVMRLAGATGAN